MTHHEIRAYLDCCIAAKDDGVVAWCADGAIDFSLGHLRALLEAHDRLAEEVKWHIALREIDHAARKQQAGQKEGT